MIGLAFTPEQFKTLLRMVYLANTMANGQKEEDYLREYDELEQYIFSRAGDAGFPAATWKHRVAGVDAMSGGAEEEHHHPSRMFENDPELNKLMSAYDSSVTTLLLAEMLAERDMEGKHGLRTEGRLPPKEYDELLLQYTEQYENEFNKFGFNRLVIEKQALCSEPPLMSTVVSSKAKDEI